MSTPLEFRDIFDLLLPAANELLVEYQREYVDDNLYNWFYKTYDVKPTTDWTQEHSTTFNPRRWTEYREGNPIPVMNFETIGTIQADLVEFVESFSVSDRYLKYGDSKTAVTHVFPRLEHWTKAFLKAGLMTMSRDAAIPYLDVFGDLGIYTAADGQPLASSVHADPDGTGFFGNKIGNNLDEAGLRAAFALADTWHDKYGNPLSEDMDTLIVPAALEEDAWRIVANTVRPGATNDERNYWQGRIKNIVTMPWWKEYVQAGSSQWWGLTSSRTETFFGRIGEMPNFLDRATYPNAVTMHVTARMSYVFYWVDWRGTVWSDGSET